MAKRAAKGAGSIHRRTHTRNGKEYTYWEARVTTGQDPLTGKQVQRTFSGKTQKEVLEKMQAVAVEVSRGTYVPPCKMTVGEWLDIWQTEYLRAAKFNTVRIYTSNIKNHIKPALGTVRLDRLHPHTVQMFINRLEGLAPQTVRMIYQVLHLALEKAVDLEYIPKNPATRCVLPKKSQKEIKPLDDAQATALLATAKGTELEYIITVALFTGMRISELLGLTWDSVDMEAGTVTVDKQLSRFEVQSENLFAPPKAARPEPSPRPRLSCGHSRPSTAARLKCSSGRVKRGTIPTGWCLLTQWGGICSRNM